MSVSKAKIDFTNGNIFSKLIRFALPIIATNLLQMLYNAADLMIVSLSNEPNAVGAVGMAGSPVNLIINIFIGFSLGSNVIVARHIGAKDKDGAQRATHTALIIALFFGLAASILGFFLARPLLTLMGAPLSVIDLSVTYMKIYFAGALFIALSNALVSIFRAKGDSKTPLIVLGITGLINVGLNLLFVLAFGLSVEGVALATVISYVISALTMLIKLTKSDEFTKFSFKKLKLDNRCARNIIYIGFPSAIQGALISVTNMLIASSLATLDSLLTPDPNLTPVLNGNSAQNNLDNFIYTGMDAISAGVISFIGQNYGAHNADRIKKGLHAGILLSTITGLSLALIISIFKTPLLSLYGVVNGAPGTADAVAYEIASKRIYIMTIPYFVCGIMNVCTGALKSIGKQIQAFAVSLTGLCVFRILWTSFVFPLNMTIETLLIGYPITWVASAIIGYILIIIAIRKFSHLTLSKTSNM